MHKIISAFLNFITIVVIAAISLYYSFNFISNELNENRLISVDNQNIKLKKTALPIGFVPLNKNNSNGPITVDKESDDGSKLNISEFFNESNTFDRSRIAIATFDSDIKVNSVNENSISELYQYANIHGYDLLFYTTYMSEQSMFHIKLSKILEAITKGLKEKCYDWIFWIDDDITICNPNIQLETFLPKDNDVQMIVSAKDKEMELNAFFIKVNSWSYNYIVNVLSYNQFNADKQVSDQTTLLQLLSERQQDNYYSVIPPNYFNKNYEENFQCDFIMHFTGESKDETSKNVREKVRNNKNISFSKTNAELRNEILQHY